MERRMRGCLLVIALVIATAVASGAYAQHDDGDDGRARLLGALVASHLTGHFDDAPARSVIEAIAKAIDVPIRGRYLDDRIGHGIDPDAEINLAFENLEALDLLELVLEQCELDEPCTWQLRPGFIEVGTKERLSTPAAAERRMYAIGDLLIEPPVFATSSGGLPGIEVFRKHPYRSAALAIPVPFAPDAPVVGDRGQSYVARKDQADLAPEIIRGIVQTVEPGNWDYGQLDPTGEQEPPGIDRPRAVGSTPRKIAVLRRWEDRLVVTAPDFVHRAIDGYPPPVAPPRLDDDARRARATVEPAQGIELAVIEFTLPAHPDRPAGPGHSGASR